MKTSASHQVESLMKFLDNSPCNFYAAANVASMLDDAGFTRLDASDRWMLERGGKYYVTKTAPQFSLSVSAPARRTQVIR